MGIKTSQSFAIIISKEKSKKSVLENTKGNCDKKSL